MYRLFLGIVIFILYLVFFGDLTKPLDEGNVKEFIFNLWFPAFVIVLVLCIYYLIKKLDYDDFKVR